MNKAIFTPIKQLMADRQAVLLCCAIIVLTVAYIIYVVVSLVPAELQVATRYTAFGDTQYYRNKWYYLLTFIVFVTVMSLVHISLIAKLHSRDMRSLAMAFGWLTILLLVIMTVLTHSVLGIAFLS